MKVLTTKVFGAEKSDCYIEEAVTIFTEFHYRYVMVHSKISGGWTIPKDEIKVYSMRDWISKGHRNHAEKIIDFVSVFIN